MYTKQRQLLPLASSTVQMEFKYFEAKSNYLYSIVRETHRSLKDVSHLELLQNELNILSRVSQVGQCCKKPATFVILGGNCSSRARLVNFLLGCNILPTRGVHRGGWRWLRLQYGPVKTIRLSLGSEFEVVEPLVSMNTSWEHVPVEDLQRNEPKDLSTVMDIELNNPILKSGIRIMVPPDIGPSIYRDYQMFMFKRSSLLQGITPVFLYGIDNIRKTHSPTEDSNNVNQSDENISNPSMLSESSLSEAADRSRTESNCDNSLSEISVADLRSQSEGTSYDNCDAADDTKNKQKFKTSVFTEENIHDLNQMQELHPEAQILFVLFSDSVDNSVESTPLVKSNFELSSVSGLDPSKKSLNERDGEEEKERDDSSNDEKSLKIKKNLENFLAYRCPSFLGEDFREKKLLLQKQKSFLIDLIEQLEDMSHPMSKRSLAAHWMIVDDSVTDPLSDSGRFYNSIKLSLQTRRRSYDANKLLAKRKTPPEFDVILDRDDFIQNLTNFVKGCLKEQLLQNATRLSEIHTSLVQQFILSSYDMAREMQIVPRKIQYVAITERQLYETLSEKFVDGERKLELLVILQKVLQDMKISIDFIDWREDGLPCYEEPEVATTVFYDATADTTPKQKRPLSSGANNVLSNSTPNFSINHSAENLVKDSWIEEEYEIVRISDDEEGYRSRLNKKRFKTTNNVENSDENSSSYETDIRREVIRIFEGTTIDSKRRLLHGEIVDLPSGLTSKQASLEVQRLVLTRLSEMISIELVKYVDCLRESYFGTLQRSIESLELAGGAAGCSDAVKQLLSVPEAVDLRGCASFSVVRQLLEHVRRFFYRLRLGGLSIPGSPDGMPGGAKWRRQVAKETVDSLNAMRLARIITVQLRDRLRVSHERYQSALGMLEATLAGRLQHTEDIKLAIRKKYAPGFARLCLESTSLCDLLKHGAPDLGREIGRGQYGVVFGAGRWAGREPCAIKSVVPPDERHYNELAMEFFYARSIPSHPRILRLYGSIVDHGYPEGGLGSGGCPAVLLVMERLHRDLYAALRARDLDFAKRMRISIDIVEGIRYLHSLGLVHRDIKMKNVLLDRDNRARLTDLGFCAPGALMSGSVVGTPVHMAPDLLTGCYDSSVDVYAFGVLFWYVCAGTVSLPSNFENFQNKEQLWSCVKRGLRPERVPSFSDQCWSVMEACWAANPQARPLLGDVQPVLEDILCEHESKTTEALKCMSIKEQINSKEMPT